MVGGVILGKGGNEYFGLLVFNLVYEVKYVIEVNVLVIYVLLFFVVDLIFEVIDVEMELIVCIIEGILVLDMMKVKCVLVDSKLCLIGLNCLGVIIFDVCKIGIMFGYIYKCGLVGVVFCLGILIYEVVKQIVDLGLGQLIVVGIGGDFIKGIEYIDVLDMFFDDLEIILIIMIGEIGGIVEEEVVEFLVEQCKKGCWKLIVGFIVGCIVFFGCCMGYVGVIVVGGKGDVELKIEVMKLVGIVVVDSFVIFGEVVMEVIKNG